VAVADTKQDGTPAIMRLSLADAAVFGSGEALAPSLVDKLGGLSGDIEEGLLVLSREERELLLEVLSETRARRSLSSAWCAICCPCRRRLCGHRQRHKL